MLFRSEAYAKLKDMGFKIDAFYSEMGMCFAGRFLDGEEEYAKVDFSKPNWADDLSEDLAEFLEDDYLSYKDMVKEDMEETSDA